MKRLIKKQSKQESIDLNSVANYVYSSMNIGQLQKDIMDVILRVEKKETYVYGDEYDICLHYFVEENDHDYQPIAISRMFRLPYVDEDGVVIAENILWDRIFKTTKILEEKLKNSLNLDGHVYFGFAEDGHYSMFYKKEAFERDENVENLIQEVTQSYEQKMERYKNLPNLIMDSYSAGKTEEAKEMEKEYSELNKIFAKKTNRLIKKTSNFEHIPDVTTRLRTTKHTNLDYRNDFNTITSEHLDEGPYTDDYEAGKNTTTCAILGTMDLNILLNLPGRNNENRVWREVSGEKWFGNYKEEEWHDFLEDIKENGLKYGVFIGVEKDGTAHIYEGNHRVQAAKQLGWTEIPVEVRYYGNSQRFFRF
jgi:hypothetical protein